MNTKCITAIAIFPILLAAATWAQPGEKLPPIEQIQGAKPKPAVFKASGSDAPLVLKSRREAAKSFGREALARLAERVDFDRQVVLVFAWSGSGGDRLTHRVQESFPEQVVFSLKPGMTRDLRRHVEIFALRSNVKWKVAGGKRPADEAAEYIKVEVKGQLNSRVVAIGAETTGYVISASGARWELDFGRDEEARRQADALHGKRVIVTGRLHVKPSVEIRQRWIVTVDSLKAAAANGDTPVNDSGT